MVEDTFNVGLVLERRAGESEWSDIAWRPLVVFATAPDTPPWTPLGADAKSARFYAGACALSLYSTETENYLSNLGTGRPMLWVVMRPTGPEPPVDIVAVTADPAEGEAFTETGTDTVETVAMPSEIAARVAAFCEQHHIERPMIKRKRQRAEPEALAQRPAGQGPTERLAGPSGRNET